MLHLSIDIETYSDIDIKKAGAYKYAQSENFEILLFAYSVDNGQVEIVDLKNGGVIPEEIVTALNDPSVTKHAFNATFEWWCLNQAGYRTSIEQWACTMVHSLYLGYPGSLKAVGEAVGLPQEKQKLRTGTALINYFCSPCKPTKVNGGRDRNLPHHDKDKWDLFKEYCIQDVVTEMEIERRLSNFPVPKEEHDLWVIDQKINSNGVRIDSTLVRGALEIDDYINYELVEKSKEITGLDNPNSNAQLMGWLNSKGVETDNLQKATVADLVENMEDGEAKEVLQIRQETSKTSIKKYATMENAKCNDDRVRGLLQFYGANRTGRWAGRLVQVQNLPRNYINTLDLARELSKIKNIDTLKIIYGNVTDTLSQLIRTAFIPTVGNKFVVADFASIEARVLAWLADEQWKIEVSKTHGKFYEATASQMFGVPIEKIKKGNPEYSLRSNGKVAELACIAEGELVLTDRGLVPIEKITLKHKLWDGKGWVTHEGVIYKGKKEVIEYGGLRATRDHIVWVEGQRRPIQFGEVATSGQHLLQSGNGREAVWIGGDYKPRKKIHKWMAGLLCSSKMSKLWDGKMDILQQFKKREIKRMSGVFPTKTNSEVARQKANGSEAEMHESKRQKLLQVWGKRHRIQIRERDRSGFMDNKERGERVTIYGDGQDRHKWALRKGKHKIYIKREKSGEQETDSFKSLGSNVLALLKKCCNEDVIIRENERRNYKIGGKSCRGKKEELGLDRGKANVYDIRNAGRYNRYTVSNCLVHNCGYQGGSNALIAMGALDMGLTEDELPDIVRRWRGTNKRIVDFWYAVENAVLHVMQTGQAVGLRGLIFAREGDLLNGQDFLTITLPSKRKLYYPKPSLKPNAFGKMALHYMGLDTGKWKVLSTYGGKLVENITQAVARDCLAETIKKIDKMGLKIVMHIHDEVVIDAPQDIKLDDICQIMAEPISWAPGLCLKGAGFEGDYYMKD